MIESRPYIAGTFNIVAFINEAPHVTLNCSYSPVTDIFSSLWIAEILPGNGDPSALSKV